LQHKDQQFETLDAARQAAEQEAENARQTTKRLQEDLRVHR